MSSPADSFFNIFFTLMVTIVFFGTIILTAVAPFNIYPGSLIFPKYKVVCVLACELVEVPINGIWSGIVNGITYNLVATAVYAVIRSIRRRNK